MFIMFLKKKCINLFNENLIVFNVFFCNLLEIFNELYYLKFFVNFYKQNITFCLKSIWKTKYIIFFIDFC